MTMVDQLGYNIRPCFIFCKSLETKHRMIMLQQRMIICCLCFLWRMKRWSGSQARTVLQLEARTKNGCHKFAIFSVSISIIEEELDRREGKCRCCWLGNGIDSMSCSTRDLAPLQFEEQDEQKNRHLAECMLQKMDNHLVHTKPPPSHNGCSCKNYSVNHPCC